MMSAVGRKIDFSSTKYYVPQKMKSSRTWVLWKLEPDKNGRLTKVPYQTDGHKASSTDPKTWTTYEDAYNAWINDPQQFSGIGYVVTKESRVVFCDVDHCIAESGELSETAADILTAYGGNTYVEVSQSGSGLHLFALGEIPRSFNNRKYGVEMYADGRYVAFTGNSIVQRDIEPCPDAIAYVFDKYKTQAEKTQSIDELRRLSQPMTLEDNEIIQRASRYGKFAMLYNGDFERAGYGSQSEADIALCIALAYWCDRNPDAIDRIFRSSALYREKWERSDYRNKTISKACACVDETITEKVRRKNEFIRHQLREW